MDESQLSHHISAHSFCSAPVRQLQMLHLHCSSNSLFYPPFFHTLCLFREHSRILQFCTFTSPPLSTLPPFWELEATVPVTHHLVITGIMGALVAPVWGCPLWIVTGRERAEESPPQNSTESRSPSSPTFADDENSVSMDYDRSSNNNKGHTASPFLSHCSFILLLLTLFQF